MYTYISVRVRESILTAQLPDFWLALRLVPAPAPVLIKDSCKPQGYLTL